MNIITSIADENPFYSPDHYLLLDLSPFDHQPQTVNVEWDQELTLCVENWCHQDLVILVNKVESVCNDDTFRTNKFF